MNYVFDKGEGVHKSENFAGVISVSPPPFLVHSPFCPLARLLPIVGQKGNKDGRGGDVHTDCNDAAAAARANTYVATSLCARWTVSCPERRLRCVVVVVVVVAGESHKTNFYVRDISIERFYRLPLFFGTATGPCISLCLK